MTANRGFRAQRRRVFQDVPDAGNLALKGLDTPFLGFVWDIGHGPTKRAGRRHVHHSHRVFAAALVFVQEGLHGKLAANRAMAPTVQFSERTADVERSLGR
jgi:hypothetical protein